MNRSKTWLVSVPLLCVVLGCGSSGSPNAPASVKGKVTYKGSLVTGGNMMVYKDAGYPVTIQADGSYRGVDLPDGDVIITVDTELLKPKSQLYQGKKMPLGPTPQGANVGSAGQYVEIPAKYRSAKSSPLKYTLKKGEQVIDIELTD